MRLWDMLKAENGMAVGRAFPALWGASRQNTVATITGVPPLTFRSGGMALADYTILGNSYQDGTPTPDDPVEVVSVGDRAENLVNIDDIALLSNDRYGIVIDKPGTYTFNAYNATRFYVYVRSYDSSDNPISDNLPVVSSTGTITAHTLTITQDEYILLFDPVLPSNPTSAKGKFIADHILAVEGSTAPESYIPYGYKIPITCGGVTQNIYLDEPLRKQLNGDAADALNYATQTLTRRVGANCDPLQTPTTETVELPQIPTINGQNTLSIGTTMQPSTVSITGHINPSSSYGNLTDINGVYIKDKDGVQIKVTG